MSKNLFDDEWGAPKESALWGSEDESTSSGSSNSVNLKFKLNPKVAAISTASLIGVIILASVIPGLFGGGGKPNVLPQTSKSPNAPAALVDLYTQPRMLQSFIDNALASSVTIYCGQYSGSGWAIDLSDDSASGRDDSFQTEIITNHHVIEGCETSGVTFVPMGGSAEFDALVYSFDIDNDLAVLMTDKYLPPLATMQPGNETHVGQWVMAVGSPGAGSATLDGSVTTGTITNLKEGVVITDTTINPGNSGGPLLNAAGQVVAVVSAKVVEEKVDSIGLARDVALICEQLNGCSKKQMLK